MRVGFATFDVTPPVGAPHVGGLTERRLQGLRDPLRARAAVLGTGSDRIALVAVDILHIEAEYVAAARGRVQRLTGILPERVLVAASHTHQGAPASERTVEGIATAVAAADDRAREAWLAVGVGREGGVSFNRRFRMRGGYEVTHPGKGNPDIVAPGGPIDPDVGVWSVWDGANGELLGCLVNFACHATTLGGRHISADWIWHLDRTVRGVMGRQAVVLFAGGAAGDVTQVDNRSRAQRQFGEDACRLVGQSVGAEVLKVLTRARPAPGGDAAWPLDAVLRTLALEARRWPDERIARARARLEAGPPEGWDAEYWRAQRVLEWSLAARDQAHTACELQVVQVGPLALVANPTELFCSLGLEIKRDSPFPHTFVVTLANGWLGYAPTATAFAPHGGGYEQGVSRLAPGSGEAIRDACTALLHQAWTARPAEAPTWDPLPVGRPWDMGSVRGGE